jgi:hypothetical protein
MQIEDAEFADESIEHSFKGAGVVPVSHNSEGERVYLLGRERWCPAWKGSSRWSGFEGSRKEHETVIDTASRELSEESMGVVGSHSHVRTRLTTREYAFRVVLRIRHERFPDEERYHVTYVLPVEWTSFLPDSFHELRNTIEKVQRMWQELQHTRPVCLEHVEEVGPLDLDNEDQVTVLYRMVSGESGVVSARSGSREYTDLIKWDALRTRLEVSLPDHPSVVVRRDTSWNILQSVSVSMDHLEKDKIRWWTRSELERVLAQRGQDSHERFRPYFMPVLQTILREDHCLAEGCEECVTD